MASGIAGGLIINSANRWGKLLKKTSGVALVAHAHITKVVDGPQIKNIISPVDLRWYLYFDGSF